MASNVSSNRGSSDFGEPKDIQIPHAEYPGWAKEKQYDGVVLYCSGDAERAFAFKQLIEKFTVLEDGRQANLCVIDKTVDIAYISGRFSALEEAMKRSTFLFLYISENFCKKEEAQAEWLRDEALMEVLHNPQRRWCLIPILTGLHHKIPFGIRALRGIAVTGLLNGRDFNDITSERVKDLSRGDLDKTILENIATTLNSKLSHRLKREKDLEKLVANWVRTEQNSRWKQRVMDIRKQQMLKEEEERETQAFLEDLDQNIHAQRQEEATISCKAQTKSIIEIIKKEIDERLRDGVAKHDIVRYIGERCKSYRKEVQDEAIDYLYSSNPQAGQIVHIHNPGSVQVGDHTTMTVCYSLSCQSYSKLYHVILHVTATGQIKLLYF